MKEILVDRHLDTTCPGLSGGESSKQPESTASPLAERTVTMSDSLRKPPTAPETTVAAARPERLPSINYSMLRDAGLRKKLTELGISAVGPRATLERRHKEWVAIWNANCDSPRPRRRAELLADLYAWERANLGKSGGAGGGGGGTIAVQSGGGFGFGEAAQSTVNIRDKDFDAAAWASKHNDSFKDLIASARRSAARKQGGGGTDEAPPEAPKNEGEGGEPTVSDQGASSPARREASDSEPLQDSKSTIRLEDER